MATLLWMMCTATVLSSAASQSPLAGDDTTARSPNPPLNDQEWVHPVIFEPLYKIRLTHSSYKLTTFVNFAPFLRGFQRVRDYLVAFKKDLETPTHPLQDRRYRSDLVETSLITNESILADTLKQHWCQHDPYVCNTRIKVNRIKIEMNYLDKVFNTSYNKYLTAIDHIDYHPTLPDHKNSDPILDDPTRTKRHVSNIDIDTHRAVNMLKQLDEENLTLLTSILDKVYYIHPHLNTTHYQ